MLEEALVEHAVQQVERHEAFPSEPRSLVHDVQAAVVEVDSSVDDFFLLLGAFAFAVLFAPDVRQPQDLSAAQENGVVEAHQLETLCLHSADAGEEKATLRRGSSAAR